MLNYLLKKKNYKTIASKSTVAPSFCFKRDAGFLETPDLSFFNIVKEQATKITIKPMVIPNIIGSLCDDLSARHQFNCH